MKTIRRTVVLIVIAGLAALNIQQAYGQSLIEMEEGNIHQGMDNFIRSDDGPFEWQTLQDGALRVSWYEGDANFGQAALRAAQAGLESMRPLVPLDLSQPIEIFIYANMGDLRSTSNSSGQDWAAGHADPALGVVRVVIEPGTEQDIRLEQRLPHELMHVMLYRRAGAGYRHIPVWLREGMAMLAETYPNPDYDRVLADAASTGTLIPLKDLCASFPANAGQAFLAYAESRSFTGYLRDTYGADGLLSLAASYADGVDCERGTERAFGVSLSRLELDWRERVLGQTTLGPALRNILPYLVLLCLVLLVPVLGGLSTVRRKGKDRGPESYIR
ncbi:MAG TPA: peptidase MA family metallohydrolase [Anaerolineales bacterium]|nr:peptidase MA family metallohydrolase [Anaerolineales bacterium]